MTYTRYASSCSSYGSKMVARNLFSVSCVIFSAACSVLIPGSYFQLTQNPRHICYNVLNREHRFSGRLKWFTIPEEAISG